MSQPDRFLKLREVIEMTSLSRTTIYRKMGEGAFPKPFALTPACVRWRESHIVAWMDAIQQQVA